MLPQQKRIFRAFVGVILAVNVWGALPSIYKAPYRIIDLTNNPDLVAVYEPIETAPVIPVKRIEASPSAAEPSKIVETGKSVTVAMSNGSQDESRQHMAVTTLLLAVVGLVFYTWIGKRQIKAA